MPSATYSPACLTVMPSEACYECDLYEFLTPPCPNEEDTEIEEAFNARRGNAGSIYGLPSIRKPFCEDANTNE